MSEHKRIRKEVKEVLKARKEESTAAQKEEQALKKLWKSLMLSEKELERLIHINSQEFPFNKDMRTRSPKLFSEIRQEIEDMENIRGAAKEVHSTQFQQLLNAATNYENFMKDFLVKINAGKIDTAEKALARLKNLDTGALAMFKNAIESEEGFDREIAA